MRFDFVFAVLPIIMDFNRLRQVWKFIFSIWFINRALIYILGKRSNNLQRTKNTKHTFKHLFKVILIVQTKYNHRKKAESCFRSIQYNCTFSMFKFSLNFTQHWQICRARVNVSSLSSLQFTGCQPATASDRRIDTRSTST